jgi:LacI family transcriptional regulator
MKDIAEELNVSIVSVSKALSGKDGVSDKIRSQIIEKANSLGYKYGGKGSKRKLFKAAVLIPEQFFGENTFYGEFYRKLLKYSQLTQLFFWAR